MAEFRLTRLGFPEKRRCRSWTETDLTLIGPNWTELDWIGADRTGLDWTGPDPDWTGLDRTGPDQTGLDSTGPDRAGVPGEFAGNWCGGLESFGFAQT